jgi:hypothetical protein
MCVASPSPVADHNPKRLHLATDLWSEDEHLQQDEIVSQHLPWEGNYDISNALIILFILKVVIDVACKGMHSHSLRIPPENELFQALQEVPALMKLIGDCFTNGSYKNVCCLSASILAPIVINFSDISAFPEFLHENSVSAITPITPCCMSFHRISPAFN